MRFYRSVPVAIRQRLSEVLPEQVWTRGRDLMFGRTSTQLAVSRTRARLGGSALPEQVRDDLVPVRSGRWPILAHPMSTFHAGEVLAEHCSLVADALEAAGIAYAVLRAATGERRVVVVAGMLRDAAYKALRTALRGTGTYVSDVRGDHVRRPRLIDTAPTAGAGFRLFRGRASPDGSFLSGPELGCDVQFWSVSTDKSATNASGEPIEVGSLLGRRQAAYELEIIPPAAQHTVTAEVDGRPRRRFGGLTAAHLFEVTEPIDAVYTWVDGGDRDWQRSKSEALAGLLGEPLSAFAANESRFHSRDELRYSLRSLDMYADWIRHVFVVTDGQIPGWLREDHPGLTVVSHRELFGDRGRLPTFNSHAIESQLHRIEGLAEHFLYLNDDMLFGRPVAPSLFVLGNGATRFFLSGIKITAGPIVDSDLPVTMAAKNNRELLLRRFDRAVTNKFKHAPYALRRSVMYDLERDFAEAIERTAGSQFRSSSDISIPAALAHYYAYATGRAVEGGIAFRYLDIARPETPDRLAALERDRNVDTFCLNDHDSSQVDNSAQTAMLHDFLERYLPIPSRWERQPGHQLPAG
jgi:hypothetical protein